jgi:major membrane immunogen (membrane-anchored lipoprotein)
MENVSQKRVKELADGTPTEGFVEIRLKNPKKTGAITVRDYKDGEGRHRPYVDQYGQPRILKITRTVKLDMKNMDDRLTLNQVSLHPIYVSGATKSLIIINHEEEAVRIVEDKDIEFEAGAIIRKLKGSDLHDFARVLLITVKPGSSDSIIKRVMYESAAEDPQYVLDEWNNPLREHKAFVKKGIEKGIFTQRQGRFSFKGELMGTSFDLAVDWLKENEDLMPQLTKEME